MGTDNEQAKADGEGDQFPWAPPLLPDHGDQSKLGKSTNIFGMFIHSRHPTESWSSAMAAQSTMRSTISIAAFRTLLMIDSIKEFFSQFIEPGLASSGTGASSLQVATTALLLEIMRMDSELKEEERQAIVSAVQAQFGLQQDQVTALMNLAEQEARDANDYYQFTSLINQHCEYAQKVQIIENLWHVAMIDGHLDAHELHLMRKLADLLYIGHADYVAAKQRARNSAGLPA